MAFIIRTSILLGFLSLFISPADAQQSSYMLSLFVKDKSSGKALPKTQLTVNGKNYLADDSGKIVVRANSLKNFHAKFSCVGYQELDIHFYPKNPIETDTVFLTQGEGILKEVTVTGYKSGSINDIAPATVLSQEDLDKTRGESLAHLLQTIPGVNMLQTGNTIAKPIVDGLYGNRVLVINNGVRQEGQQWGLEHAPEVDPNIAQNITVVKGADAVRYGAEALGGVILLDPAPLPYNDPALHGEVNINGVSNGRGGSGSATLSSSFKGIPQLAWRIQGSYSKLGDYQTKDYFLENTGTEQKNFSGTIGYQGKHFGGQIFYSRFQTSLGISLASDIGSPADLIARLEHPDAPYVKGSFSYNYRAPYQTVLHQLLKAGVYYNTDDGSRFEVNYNLQIDHRREFEPRLATYYTIPINDWILHTNTLEGTWQKTFAEKWHTMAGINLRAQSNYNDTITLSNPFIPNYSANSVGAFGTEHLTLNNKVELEAGARFDYQKFNAASQRFIYKYITDPNGVTSAQGAYYQFGGDRKFNSFSFITGALWKINALWNIRSNLGLAWRTPNPEELYSYGLNQGASKYELGDSSLNSEHGYKWITTFTKAGDRFSFAANIYLQYIQNYIYLMPYDSVAPTRTGYYPVFKYVQTNAFFKGLDFDGRYNFGNNGKLFQYELKASLVRAYDLTKDAYLPNIPADRYTNSLQWNIPSSKKMTDNFVQVNYMYVTKQTRYEPGSDYAPPPGSYGLWGLSAGTKFLLGNGSKSLTFDISVDNLFNIAYRDYLDSWRYYTEEIGRNIQLHAIFRF